MIGNYPDPSFPPNAVIDWPEDEAKRMIGLGLVREYVDPELGVYAVPAKPAPAPTKKPKKG
jgi:hypothetical protein